MSKRILLIAIIFIVVAFLIFVGFFYGYPLYQKWQIQRQSEKFLEEYTKPYKEDIYGGATPEETWNMFLEALKKGDVELAAKYFEVKEQEKWGKNLKIIKEKGMIENMINDLSTLKRDSIEESLAWYSYTAKDTEGDDISTSVLFIKNTFTNIWKISSL